MNDKTIIESDKTMIENNKTLIETDKTIIESDFGSESLSLKTFRGNPVIKEFEAIGAESDTFLIKKDGKEYFLKLYRKGVKVNEELLELIYNISKKYEYFNEIIEYGYDKNLNRFYEISKYLPKGNINKLNFPNAKPFIKQLNEALHILHKHNIIHRDLKPTNILIKKENPLQIALIDFGVSSLLDEGFTKKLTTVKGTYAYFSPEGVSGYIGKESDYFSFGMVLLALLDKNPFSGLDNAVIINTLVTQNVPIPPTLDKQYQTLLKGLLTRDPKKRWGYEEVNEWLRGKEVKVFFDEQENTSKKYKFQGKYYSINELAIAFLQEENFEVALKHIARGYIEKYLETLEEYDLIIQMEEQEKPLNKLVYFVYTLNPNLDFILYGRIIDKEYIFQLLLKKIANELNEVENIIFKYISNKKFFNVMSLYEKLTNTNTNLIDFLSKIDFSNLEKFLDIENIVLSQDNELIELALKFIDLKNVSIFHMTKAFLKTKNYKFIDKFYKQLEKYDYEIFKFLFENNYKIDISKLNGKIFDKALNDKKDGIIRFLLKNNILPNNKYNLQKYLAKKGRFEEIGKYCSKEEIFEFLKDNLQYVEKLFDYIDKSKASELLDKALENNNEEINIEFLLDNKIKPQQQIQKLLNWIIENNLFKYLHLFDVEMFKKLFLKNSLQGHNDSIFSIAISSDNKFIISGSYDKTIKIWDVQTGECLKILKGHNGRIESIAISSDNKFIVSGSGDGTIKIWDVKTGRCLKTLKLHPIIYINFEEMRFYLNKPIAISSDNQFIISGSSTETIKIWDVQTGECLKTLEGNNDVYIFSVTISSDNKFIVSGSGDKTIKIWDVQTGECLKILKGHKDWVSSVVISSDNKFIISGSYDKTIKIWDVQTRECLKTLEGHKDFIYSIAISSDNKFIVSGSGDKTIKIWDVQTGECLKTLEGHTSWVNSVAISSNNKFIVSGSNDGTIKIWNITIEEILRENIKFIEFNTLIKLIEENLLDLKKIIKFLVKNNFEYLKKILKQLPKEMVKNKVFEFLEDNSNYIQNLFEYVEKEEVGKLFDKILKTNNKNSIEFLLSKKNLPNDKYKLQKYLTTKGRFEEIGKYCSKEEIFKFLKTNVKYIPNLYTYLDNNQLLQLLNYCIQRNYPNNINFLIQKLIKKDCQKELKTILKREYKRKNKKVVEIFKNNGIKLSFFERLF